MESIYILPHWYSNTVAVLTHLPLGSKVQLPDYLSNKRTILLWSVGYNEHKIAKHTHNTYAMYFDKT